MMELLTDTVDLRRQVAGAPSSTGVETDTTQTVATVPASVQARSAAFRELAAGQTETATYVGFFLIDPDATRNPQIDDDVIYRGRTYKVTFVKNVRGHHLEADLMLYDETTIL